MANSNKKIDQLINEILNEEIENKVRSLTEGMGEWTEIKADDKLHGNQKYIASKAEPKNKITAKDFEVLRKQKKETNEELGVYQGDEDEIDDAEEQSQQEPTYVGMGLKDNKMMADIRNKIYGSFEEQGDWYDEEDVDYEGQFDFDYDEEEFDEFEPFYQKYGEKTKWFAPGNEGKKFFNMYKNRFGPMIVRIPKNLDEAETEEGNAFSGARQRAIDSGETSFEFEGERYPVTGSRKMANEAKENKKWIQKTGMKKGALHKKLGVPEDETIPVSKLNALKKDLMKKAKDDKKLTKDESKLMKQVNLALTLKNIKEDSNKLSLSEDELIDLIENIVLEEKQKAEKENISKKSPIGLKKTEKVLGQNKKENDDYVKSFIKKMKDYVKDGSIDKDFDANPTDFPRSNYDKEKEHKEMKYNPSKAVEEYIDAFAYPGMTNLVFDEIKPDDEKIDKYLQGDRTTGNAEVDESGKALGNVVPSKVGKKFKKNYDENLYGVEQREVSYKRYPQDTIEVAGSNLKKGKLQKRSSQNKTQAIMNQLESTDKKVKMVNEDIEKMKKLISYDSKTQ